MTTLTKPGRPTVHPIALVRIWLCGCKQTEPLKAVTHDGGLTWEIVSLDPVFRGAVLRRKDLEVLKPEIDHAD